ncbi:Alcohol dehydrogenase-like 5 [Sesamum alatum]|uniref:Alcohol dehydrogenase-like 5 n=1 Tax=Sesamum alatum TaxID=300844 RepID=A0AAE1YQN6_9LAMI|nr:Alcohol dehydrogenase-like 5 [Sesamum alatum]
MPRDGTTRFLDLNGNPIHHFFSVSSFSQYTVVDITHVVKIRRDFPVDKACLLSCGVTTGVGAVCKIAEVEEGSTVAIFGLGSVGLAVAEGARLQGASKIIGVDINPEKFELGKKFGVTDFINPNFCTEKTVCQVIQEMTGGGADYCFECIGLVSLMQDAFNSSRRGCGKTIILGLEMHGTSLSINPYSLLEGRSVIGCLFGGLKPKSDIPIIAQKYLDKELHLDEFISHEIELKDINTAFEMLHQANCLSFPRSMAEVDASKPQSLAEQYLLEEKEKKSDVAVKSVEESEVKPSIDAPTGEIVQKTEETPTGVDSEVAPAATGGDSEASDSAAGDSKEASPADANLAPSEESNDNAESESTDNQEAEETPEIKLETAPADFRFPTTNQTRHCFTRYIEYHRCIAAKGEGAPECDKFAKYYRSLCPGEWIDRWNEQRENGTFPGPL